VELCAAATQTSTKPYPGEETMKHCLALTLALSTLAIHAQNLPTPPPDCTNAHLVSFLYASAEADKSLAKYFESSTAGNARVHFNIASIMLINDQAWKATVNGCGYGSPATVFVWPSNTDSPGATPVAALATIVGDWASDIDSYLAPFVYPATDTQDANALALGTVAQLFSNMSVNLAYYQENPQVIVGPAQ
jgi:hypothetical protein